MRASQDLSRISTRFDDPNLVSDAGLLAAVSVAQALGLADLAAPEEPGMSITTRCLVYELLRGLRPALPGCWRHTEDLPVVVALLKITGRRRHPLLDRHRHVLGHAFRILPASEPVDGLHGNGQMPRST